MFDHEQQENSQRRVGTPSDALEDKKWLMFRPLSESQVRRYQTRFASDDMDEFLGLSRQVQALLIAAQDD